MGREDINFIKKWFRDKKDASNRLIWRHAESVASRIKNKGRQSGEMGVSTLKKLRQAALGHDLLEDTKVSKRTIERRWGKEVAQYIEDLSNPHGDRDFRFYIKHLREVPEEVLLVKFADILDNLSNSVKQIENLESGWVRKFWLPLAKKYEKTLFGKKFSRYPKTARSMVKDMKAKIQELSQKANSQ